MSYIEDVTASPDWAAVAGAAHHDPHSVLGTHPETDALGRTTTTIRARRPLAESVEAVPEVVEGSWADAVVGPTTATSTADTEATSARRDRLDGTNRLEGRSPRLIDSTLVHDTEGSTKRCPATLTPSADLRAR